MNYLKAEKTLAALGMVITAAGTVVSLAAAAVDGPARRAQIKKEVSSQMWRQNHRNWRPKK